MVHLGFLQEVACTYSNCGFLSKFVTVDGKYRKCQKNIHFYLINPIPGNPGPISRESGNGKIIPGIWEREIPGMKHYPRPQIGLVPPGGDLSRPSGNLQPQGRAPRPSSHLPGNWFLRFPRVS
jgi:hypothetical protein